MSWSRLTIVTLINHRRPFFGPFEGRAEEFMGLYVVDSPCKFWAVSIYKLYVMKFLV